MNDLLNTLQSWQARKAEVVQVALATVSPVKFNRHWLQWFLGMAAESYLLLINLWVHVWYTLNPGCDFSGRWALWPGRFFHSGAVVLAALEWFPLLCNGFFPEDIFDKTWNHVKSSLLPFPFLSECFPPLAIHTHSCSFPGPQAMRKQQHLLLFLFTWLELIFLWNIIIKQS